MSLVSNTPHRYVIPSSSSGRLVTARANPLFPVTSLLSSHRVWLASALTAGIARLSHVAQPSRDTLYTLTKASAETEPKDNPESHPDADPDSALNHVSSPLKSLQTLHTLAGCRVVLMHGSSYRLRTFGAPRRDRACSCPPSTHNTPRRIRLRSASSHGTVIVSVIHLPPRHSSGSLLRKTRG